jgi:RHS repeat-associated protein
VLYTSNGVTGETVTDPNGNSIVSTANGWTDSVGNQIPGSTSLPGYADNGQGAAEDPVPGVPISVGATDCPTGTASARDWVVPTEGNTSQHYYLCYSTFTYQTAFNVSYYIPTDQIGELSSSSPNSRPALLLSAIMLPNQTSYKFSYDPQYLSLTELDLPTGGSIQYQWQTIFLGSGNSIPVSRALKTRTVNDGNGNSAKWTYHWQLNETTNSSGGQSLAPPFYSSVTDPLGNDSEYQFDGSTFTINTKAVYNGCGPHDTVGAACSGSGTLMKTESYTQTQITSNAADPNTPGWQQGTLYRPTTTVTTLAVAGGSRVTKTVTTLSPPYGAPCSVWENLGSTNAPYLFARTSSCSQFPQTASVAEYGYGTSGPGSLLRTDTTTYQWQVSNPALAANLLDIPSSIVRTDGSGSWASQTGYGYDGAGNQTSVSRFLSSSSSLTSTTQYNSQGMPTLFTDPKGHETSISAYQCSGAFPETVITPYGSTTTVVETTTYGYDCTTGEITSVKDPNGQTTGKITSYVYDDPLNRLKQVTYPDGGSLTINYVDAQGASLPYVTTSQATGEAAGPITKQTDYDGLGRQIHQILTSDPSGADYVDTTYDLLGRVKTVSNPHRPSSPVPTEDGTTTYVYDALGRKVQEQEPDGVSSQQWCFGGTTLNGVNNCHPDEAGNSDYWVDHADETGRDWQQTMDALGRTSEAMEPNTSNVPTLKTDYAYDANDNLRSVLQHGGTGDTARQRLFIYDALSRLTNACNPESLPQNTSNACTSTSGPWSQIYAYDSNGNVQTRTDAKSVVTTYTYDDLDRVTAKNYSDGETLNAYFNYDTAPCSDPSVNPNTIGRLNYSWTSPSTTNVGPSDPNQVTARCYIYDPLGRIVYLDNAVYPPGAPSDGYGGGPDITYDLAGNVSTIWEGPNGAAPTPLHFFNYTYDGAGRLLTVTLNPTQSPGVPTSIPTTVFQAAPKGSAPAYSAMGLEHAQLSVTASGQPVMLYDHSFDQRGRPATAMYTTGAGAVGGAGSQTYSYTMGYLGNGSVSSAADSVIGSINIGNAGYDNLNRLAALTYTNGAYGGINAAWTYDNFGNQLSQTLSGHSSTTVPGNTTTHYDAQNHISFTSRDNNALPYDADGNLIYDVQYAYAYDAENRLCAIKSGTTYKIYVYDAEGNRIAKGNITPQGTPNPPTVSLCSPLKNSFSITQAYAIGLNGEELENYTPGQTWHNTNVYNGNSLIATYAGNYMSIPMTDWQGTRRAQLRNNQSISGIMDFLSLPYGDGFTMVGGTTFDSLVQFTGQQYNQEDNLYNFKTRDYGDWVGRFMSPDPSGLYLANPTNPQSLNLYSYARNNPLSNTDPTGLDCVYFNDAGNGVESVDRNSSSGECNSTGGDYVRGALASSGSGYFPDSNGGSGTFAFTSSDANGTYTTYVNAPGSQNDGTSCSGNCTLANGFIPSYNGTPEDVALNPFAQAVFTQVAHQTAWFPDVCSGGAFVYGGVQGGYKGAHGSLSYLGNYDTKGGWSNSALGEGSGSRAGAGGTVGGAKEGLVFVPFAGTAGGLVGVSKEGVAVGEYAGTPENFPVGAGDGAYFNISTMGGCHH